MKKGLFISFEGIEGCGKTTQAKRLFKYLVNQGYKCILTQEPGGTGISKKIREILLDTSNKKLTPVAELFLYLADRSQHTEEVILPALKSNKIVITDRSVDSTIAYQGGGREISMETIKTLNQFVTKGITPNITILLDIAPEKGLARIKNKDRMELEKIKFYKKVRGVYINIAKKEPGRVKIINGDLKIEEIELEIRKFIQSKTCLPAGR
ncbi:MAG: dTMP kinase [bacterium]|nr:dTMP kinase [bacterium]